MPKKTDKNIGGIGLYEQLKNYNESHAESPIRFIHGSSSIVFNFMGRRTQVKNKDGSLTEKEIPQALLPSGKLRKQYGVYPVSGELGVGVFNEGKRKFSLNYNSLSCMDIAELGYEKYGALIAASYASKFSKQGINVKVMHDNVTRLIMGINENNYLRTLKVLLMHFSNLVLIDSQSFKKTPLYLKQLRNEISLLHDKKLAWGEDTKEFERLTDKYMAELVDIAEGRQYAFKADDNFKDAVLNQFPVVFCSSVVPEDVALTSEGIKKERVYSDGLNISEISLMFTDENNIDQLKKILDEMGVKHVEVRSHKIEERDYKEVDGSIYDWRTLPDMLLNARDLYDLKMAIEILKFDLSADIIEGMVLDTLAAHLNDYFKSGDTAKLEMVKIIMFNTEFRKYLLSDEYLLHGILLEYNQIQTKLANDKNYNVESLGENYSGIYARYQVIPYIRALIDCVSVRSKDGVDVEPINSKCINTKNFEKFSAFLNDYIKGIDFKNPSAVDKVKLDKLDSLLEVLKFDFENTAQSNKKNILENKISYVKNILNDFIKSHTTQPLRGTYAQLLNTLPKDLPAAAQGSNQKDAPPIAQQSQLDNNQSKVPTPTEAPKIKASHDEWEDEVKKPSSFSPS